MSENDRSENQTGENAPKFLNQSAVQPNMPKIISFDELSRCGDEIWIENRGDLYRLRRTKQGKLILTK